MPTLIFTPRFTDDSQALWKAAGDMGWTTERLGGWRVPEHLRSLPEPVLYGEALFGPALVEQLGCRVAWSTSTIPSCPVSRAPGPASKRMRAA